MCPKCRMFLCVCALAIGAHHHVETRPIDLGLNTHPIVSLTTARSSASWIARSTGTDGAVIRLSTAWRGWT